MTPRRSMKLARQKRIVYHVVPSVTIGWWVKGHPRWWALTQVAAIAIAVRFARADRAAGRLAQVVLHGRDGKIRWERTYGADPERRRG